MSLDNPQTPIKNLLSFVSFLITSNVKLGEMLPLLDECLINWVFF